MDGQYRFVDLACPPACGRGSKKGTGGGTISAKESRIAQGLGKSRGGLTTKLHLVAEGRGLPLTVHLTAGNVNDCTAFEDVMAGLRVPRPGPGRPRTRPDKVLADKAYSSKKIRAYLRRRRIIAVIPEKDDQKDNRRRKGRAGGRPPAFDAQTYKQRNVVERCFNKLKQFRAIATRFDKLADRYLAGVKIACLILWLRATELSDTA
jgi:transposase